VVVASASLVIRHAVYPSYGPQPGRDHILSLSYNAIALVHISTMKNGRECASRPCQVCIVTSTYHISAKSITIPSKARKYVSLPSLNIAEPGLPENTIQNTTCSYLVQFVHRNLVKMVARGWHCTLS